MRILHIIDFTGDTEVDLDTDIDLAKRLFEEAIANGKVAYMDKNNERVITREFDPEADQITVRPVYVGG